MRKVFVFDIDGVLADFILGFTTLAQEMYPKVIPYSTYQQKTWGQFAGLSSVQESEVWRKVMSSTSFWTTLKPLVTYIETYKLGKLQEVADVYFATSRHGVDALRQTKIWCRDNLQFVPSIVVTKYKGEFCRVVGATYAIDDKADNASCIAWTSERHNGITIPYILDRPYNRYDDQIIGSKHVRRVNSLEEYLDACLKEC